MRHAAIFGAGLGIVLGMAPGPTTVSRAIFDPGPSSAAGIVEFTRPLSTAEREDLGASLLSPVADGYFSRVYRVGSVAGLERFADLVVKVEPVTRIESSSVDPGDARPIGNDPLSLYQWALLNQGQTLIHDITDIRSEKVRGAKGEDVGLDPADPGALDLRMSADATVAVLDTGVSLDHPELRSRIAKNAAECDTDGSIRLDATDDRDGNGFAGDCMGWNFASVDPKGDARPYDDVGHGTHISGILAAEGGNGVGVRGLSSRIRILPVKVLSRDEETKDPDKKPGRGLSDRLAAGILYATSRKVDVINLSLGWPRAADTEYLRQAVKKAIDQGIIVVAAAGNNSHEGVVYPCAYPGVVCVGAITASGELADFSNSGGFVDLLAPGDRILSTIPSKIAPTYFKTTGYDLRDGTSQAAPYVAGAMAILRKIHPDESNAVLLARLQSTAGAERGGLFGSIRIAAAARASAVPHVVPVFKDLQDLPYRASDGRFSISIPIRNLWKPAAGVKVAARFESGAVSVDRAAISDLSLASGESRVLEVAGALRDLSDDSSVAMVVRIEAPGSPAREFRKRLNWVRRIDLAGEASARAIEWKGAPVAIGQKSSSGALQSFISTVLEPGAVPSEPLYYVAVPSKRGVEIRILDLKGRKMREIGAIARPQAERLLEIVRVQVDGEGSKDLVAVTLEKGAATQGKASSEYLVYCYYDESGVPLYGEKSCLPFRPEAAVASPRLERWTAAEVDGNRYLVPAFVDDGLLPTVDLDPDEWKREPNQKTAHLYRLEPVVAEGALVLRDRAVDTQAARGGWRQAIGAGDRDEIRVLSLFPQSAKDLERSEARGLISVGRGGRRQVYAFELGSNGEFRLDSRALDDPGLDGLAVESPLLLRDGGAQPGEAISMSGVFDSLRAVRVWLEPSNDGWKSRRDSFVQSEELDSIVSPLTSFRDVAAGADLGLYQTKTRTVMTVTDSSGARSYRQALERYSFLPGKNFTQLFFPVAVRVGNALRGALYIDQSQIQSRRVAITILDPARGLLRPAALSLELPNDCRALNPIADPDRGGTRMVLLCVDAQGRWTIEDLPLAQ